jgi:hypothetical protein
VHPFTGTDALYRPYGPEGEIWLYSFFIAALEEVRSHRHASAAFEPEKDPVPIVQEPGWAPGLVWTGAENLAPPGICSPDRPVRSQ